MHQFDPNNLSVTFYLRAQLEPRDDTNYANLENKISILRTDTALYLYRPENISTHDCWEEQKVFDSMSQL